MAVVIWKLIGIQDSDFFQFNSAPINRTMVGNCVCSAITTKELGSSQFPIHRIKIAGSPDRAILAHTIMNESAISFQSDEERGSLPLLHKLRNFPRLTVEILLSKSIAANILFTGIQKL